MAKKHDKLADHYDAMATGYEYGRQGEGERSVRSNEERGAQISTIQADLHSRFGGEIKPADTRDWVAFAHEFLKPMEFDQSVVCISQRAMAR